MQSLIDNIETLLYSHNFIVIPGFGGFVAEISGAFESDGTFYPPHKSIGFNPSLTYNDGLLAQQYAESENVGFNEANGLIQSDVQELTNALNIWKHVRFGALGMLHKTENGIIFEPSNQNTFLQSSYGLVPVFFPKIEAKEEVSENTNVAHFTQNNERSGSNLFYKTVAAVAVILLLIMFPIRLIDSKSSVNNTLNEASFVPVADTIIPQIESMVESGYTYNVIIGSFMTKEKALQFIDELPPTYKDECRVIDVEQRYRVSFKSFDSESECQTFLEYFKKDNRRFADAWILKN
ncbi:MAG: hypothetical protein MJ003_06790 [Paludibacteraceae bacterium]|nr:hypothetical protein [Paludibacteraceae bacterium]